MNALRNLIDSIHIMCTGSPVISHGDSRLLINHEEGFHLTPYADELTIIIEDGYRR